MARCTFLFCLILSVFGCFKKPVPSSIRLDGSSTVFPLSEAVAEEFQKKHPVRIAIGVSGTGGGFKQFCKEHVLLIGASRPITPNEETACTENGVSFVELPVALDGIVVVVHSKNTWANNITPEELKKMWEPNAQGRITKWSHIRPGWPNKEMHLFAPGVDSGTYDYFTQAIVGTSHASRGDIVSSEDDNVLVQGIASDPLAIGFLGYAYYKENASRLKVLSINRVLPSAQTIRSGNYKPLSRPVFLYANAKSKNNRPLSNLIQFYLKTTPGLAEEVGYVPLTQHSYHLVEKRFQNTVTGTLFGKVSPQEATSVEQILEQTKAPHAP